MKKIVLIVFTLGFFIAAKAQVTDSATGKVTVIKDPRMDILTKAEADINKATVGLGVKNAKGYRLLVLSSNDRGYVMKVRTQLLQLFPEEKVYMTFQAPFIKLKFGDFVEKDDAEKYRKLISNSKLVTTNVYMVPEIVEVKVDKTKDTEE